MAKRIQTTWTPEMKREAIARQLELIEPMSIPMAVVDYGLGWRKTGASARYGTRDLRHVKIYRLTVVAHNQAALTCGRCGILKRPEGGHMCEVCGENI